jgi:hypothetical protein
MGEERQPFLRTAADQSFKPPIDIEDEKRSIIIRLDVGVVRLHPLNRAPLVG